MFSSGDSNVVLNVKFKCFVCLFCRCIWYQLCCGHHLNAKSRPAVPHCLVCLLSPTVNLWTMFQAAQKLGGYELVSAHMCGNIFLLLRPGPSSSSSSSSSAAAPDVYLSIPAILPFLFFLPLEVSHCFSKRKATFSRKREKVKWCRCFITTPRPPTSPRVENTCCAARPC